MKPRPVRSQARKVRSEARWSRAVEPVFWYVGVLRLKARRGASLRHAQGLVLRQRRMVNEGGMVGTSHWVFLGFFLLEVLGVGQIR